MRVDYPEACSTIIFNLVVPVLDNYTYELFQISHDVNLYPVHVERRSSYDELRNEEAFVTWVGESFHPRIRRVLSGTSSLKRTASSYSYSTCRLSAFRHAYPFPSKVQDLVPFGSVVGTTFVGGVAPKPPPV